MKKRIEKRWKALDQPMFVFALILNPYRRLDHFGDKAGANVFTLNTLLTQVSYIYNNLDKAQLTTRFSYIAELNPDRHLIR
jgi:hypothetical protein